MTDTLEAMFQLSPWRTAEEPRRETWIQAPAGRQTFVQLGTAFYTGSTGAYLLVRAPGDEALEGELAQWRQAAADAVRLIDDSLGDEE
jgi:hypothetical protein